MSTPFFDLIEELRKLGGAPKVTFPYGDKSFPVTERVLKAKRGNHILDYGTAEPDAARYPNNKMTDQVELTADAQFVEVYRKYEILPGPFTKQGQEYDAEYGFLTTYTEGEVANGAAIGAALSDVSPEDYIKSQKKTYSPPAAALDAYFVTFPTMAPIDLPKVLLGLEVVWDTTNAAGANTESGAGGTSGTQASISLNSSIRGNGSASVLPELIPIWKPQPFGKLPVVDYFFFLPNPVSFSDIYTKVSTLTPGAASVNPWPVFQPLEHTFVVVGQKISVSAEASARVSASVSASGASLAESSGTGGSYDFGQSIRPIVIPECIHDAITLSGGATNSESVTCTAQTTFAGGTNWPTLTPSASESGTAAGFVTPTSLAATSPAAWPASGLYAESINVSPYKWSYSAVRVRVFDFASL